jgi:hypothetical protein
VEGALTDGLVQLAVRMGSGGGSLVGISGFDSLMDTTDRGLEVALDGLVALVRSVVRLDALLLRLDVCHYSSKLVIARPIDVQNVKRVKAGAGDC